ncbi:MAG TPA: phospholipid carrier-dependent glycosyltransferase [Tepidisphaeraceae bacterium]|jgi:hypothetical protein
MTATPAATPSYNLARFSPRTHLLFALLLAALVLIPRSALIARAHSDCIDDEYHLVRGLQFWSPKTFGSSRLNDPPLGEALSAIPLLFAGVQPDPATGSVLFNQRHTPDQLLLWIAIWKSILFLPLIPIVFIWIRSIYSTRCAWLATLLILFDPNLAAHIPVAAIDALGAETIVIACYCAWRYFTRPTTINLLLALLTLAIALLTKHTAIILPLAISLYAATRLFPSPGTPGEGRVRALPKRPLRTALLKTYLRHAAITLVAFPAIFFALTNFNLSKPKLSDEVTPTQKRLLSRPLPGGNYIASFANGLAHGRRGHAAYLFGEKSMKGWWYYFPVVSTYKIPVPTLLILTLALATFFATRFRFCELSILIPLVAWTIFLMLARINIGFRHFLPAYLFILMLASRAALTAPRMRTIAFSLCALSAIHATTFHPDYLSYLNFPRSKPWYAINDSNLDWGQSLKQIRRYLDTHPFPGRPIYLRFFHRPGAPNIPYYLGNRVTILTEENNPPRTGILIISPMHEAGVWDPQNRYAFLKPYPPTDTIGHAMLVYNLDQLRPPRKR